MRNRLWIGISLLLAGLLWFLALRPERPAPAGHLPQEAPPRAAEAPPPAPSAPARKPVAGIPPPEKGPAGIPGEVWTPEGLLRAEGVLLVSRKVLPETGKGLAAPFEIAVEEGRFLLTGKLETLSPEEVLDPRAFLFEEQGGGDCRAEELRWTGEEEKPFLHVVLGRRHHLECIVRNLKGDPIPGARVRVGVPLPVMHSRVFTRTDKHGRAAFDFFSNARQAVIRAFADGFEMRSALADLGPERVRAEIGLGRILVQGYAVDPRYPLKSILVRTHMANSSIAPRPEDYQAILEKAEKRLKAGPGTGVSWDITAETVEWIPDLRVEMIVTEPDGRVFQVENHYVRLDDPDLKPVLLPHADRRPRIPVVFRILPESAFLADPPETISLHFVSERQVGFRSFPKQESLASTFFQMGHRVQGMEYRFWIPQGSFTVDSPETRRRKWIDMDPRILPAGPLALGTESPETVVDLFLEPGERFIKILPVDESGFAMDVNGFVIQEDSSRDTTGFFWGTGFWLRGRFIRPGAYVFLAHDETDYRFHPLRSDLAWPAPVTGEGVWRIPVPDFSEPASAERFH